MRKDYDKGRKKEARHLTLTPFGLGCYDSMQKSCHALRENDMVLQK